MLSKEDQQELDDLIEKRQAKLRLRARAEQEAEVAGLELRAFLKSRGLDKAKASNGITAALVMMVNWRDINEELAERDFPKDEYPELYTAEYKVLKRLANERVGAKDPENTAAVSKYLGFTEHLRLRKPQKMNTRFRRRTQ